MTSAAESLISIIMPVYNAESHLEEALSSALNQTLKNIELICIDDGSTDNSPRILSRLKEADSRIHVITQDNLGAGPARNAGLKAARGSYIGFLDSDDFYPNDNCLQMLYELALENNAKIAGGSLLFYDKDKISKAVTKDADFTFSDTKMMVYKEFQQVYYYQRFIYSRDMLAKADICFPEYRRFQDVVFFVKAMVQAGEFLATEMPSYVYRKSNNYISLTDIQINDMLRGYIDVLTIAKKNGFQNIFTFLSGRIDEKSSIGEMVNSSIQGGNEVAAELYPKVLHICNAPFSEKSIKEEKEPSGLLNRLRSLFS